MSKKIALITGATGGIGFEVAKRLGNDGYRVVLNGIEAEKGQARVTELVAMGIEAEYVGFDVTDEEAVTRHVRSIGEKYGKIDCVINNAGGLGGRSPIEGMTTEFYRSVMALNLDSTFFVSRAAIPFLKNAVGSSIVNYTSNAAWNAGGPGAGIYGVSKAAVNTLTRALAKELAPAGIRVNAVSPGTIDTPFHAQIKATKPDVFASWKNSILLGRLGQPEEVASVISFLVSEDASFVTAETVQIGGGQALGI
ncbi:NAD(P)-dependent dehydrogenase, short-chain alcohol dehydrogenase family [Marisediminitalea aggregata]|uniref:NAD(P)-dependent dehydrogenase, short-chain alcohol dehydrogenase family n=1 Tax=Marisediminitalea aggregata TaxID=634436 RepID=A0A1M5LHM5_9ALTE|nr:SDR family NAD(P)-dependent oxidoreductase [Marisediminitalea aggregata]BBO26748.1 oxidoreductase [Alteromonas sp. I4]SHG64466.1 NAD(P)-dependent dehydrogenase, short-chain alcohol dehydrogenase family [Marisediminitalea aggregata]